ncbi:MAG: TonB-dependent receptor, partial [Nitrospinaceae bacterium]
MKIKSHVLLLTLFALPWAAGPATAADDAIPLEAVEITATRSALNGDETPASVTVITEEEIKEKQHRTVEELLRGEFGLDVVSQGPTGALTNVFLRGSNSSSTLVMIDGIQVNLNTAGGFNFADLTTDNIEKIEILRGPQSTLWGADAVGGVINIVTKQGQGRPTHAVSFEGGSFATFRETASSSGAIDAFDYSLSVSRTDSDGFSAANENDGNTEDDGYGNTTVSTRLGHALGAESRAELNARYSHANFDFDSFGPIDGPGFSRTDSFYISAPLSTTFAGFWNVRLTPSLAYDNSEFIDPAFTSDVTNRTYTIDLQNSLKFSPAFSLILGGEYQALNGEVKDAFDDTRDNQ